MLAAELLSLSLYQFSFYWLRFILYKPCFASRSETNIRQVFDGQVSDFPLVKVVTHIGENWSSQGACGVSIAKKNLRHKKNSTGFQNTSSSPRYLPVASTTQRTYTHKNTGRGYRSGVDVRGRFRSRYTHAARATEWSSAGTD